MGEQAGSEDEAEVKVVNFGEGMLPTVSLPKIVEQLVAVSALAYVAGFLISDLYLGSIGVTAHDLLRARYIFTGLLFLFYALLVAAPVYAVYHLSRMFRWGSTREQVLLYASTFAAMWLAVFAVQDAVLIVFGGSVLSIQPWATMGSWLKFCLLGKNGIGGGIGGVLCFLVIAYLAAIQRPFIRRTGNDDSTGENLLPTVPERFDRLFTRAGVEDLVGLVLTVGLVYLGASLVFGSTSFLNTHVHGFAVERTDYRPWTLFTAGDMLTSAAISCLVVALAVAGRMGGTGPDDGQKLSTFGLVQRRFREAVFALTVSGLLLPSYAAKMYPVLPSWAGGGSAQRVYVVTDPGVHLSGEEYLIDQTSDAFIFATVKRKGQPPTRVVVVERGSVRSIQIDHP